MAKQKKKICAECKGLGSVPAVAGKPGMKRCGACNGTGLEPVAINNKPGKSEA